MKLNGQSVILTGASQGLGRALALSLAKEGARVVLVARHLEALLKLKDEIDTLYGKGNAFAVAADVSDKNAIYPLVAQAGELAGPISLLIHNASSLGPIPLRLLSDTDCEDLEKTIGTNLVGPFRLSKAVLGSMILRKRGLIVHISSDAAANSYPSWGAYSITKSAADHLVRIWAKELEGAPVRFLSIDPGEMDTQMHADAIPDSDKSVLAKPTSVADQLLDIIRNSEEIPSGSRLIASEWRKGHASS